MTRLQTIGLVVGTALVTAATCAGFTGLAIRYRIDTECAAASPWCLGLMSHVVQTVANPDGGPQGLEGYVKVDHDTGIVRLPMGIIGNVEISGTGHTRDVRPVQSGGVFTDTGTVETWTAFTVSRPVERVPGQLQEFVSFKFANGWRFIEQGEQLLLCPPGGTRCQAF